MNARQRRAARRHPVERGYGPRHALNAQEGDELVPEELPTPPAARETRGGRLMQPILDELRQAVIPDESLAAIRADPTSFEGIKGIARTLLGAGALVTGGGKGGGLKADVAGLQARLKELQAVQSELVSGPKGEPSRGSRRMPKVHENLMEIAKVKRQLKEAGVPQLSLSERRRLLREKAQTEPDVVPTVPAGETGRPEELKRGTKGVRKNPKHVGHPPKIGVEKGFGPRHANNAQEGKDLTKIDSDVVPAMLTPREAVLNRNAAEMAGRGKIEELNEAGNELAKKGVDLAGGTENMQSKPKHYQGGGDYVAPDQKAKNPFPGRGPGGVYPQVPGLGGGPDNVYGGYRPGGNGVLGEPGLPGYGGDSLPGYGGGTPYGGGLGARDEFGRQFSQRNEQGSFGRGHGVGSTGPFNEPPGSWGNPRAMGNNYGGGPVYGGSPAPAIPSPQAWRNMPSGPFYPPGQGLRMAAGESDILGGGDSIYGKQAPVSLTAPSGLGDLVAAIKAEASKQGLNAQQIAGLLKAFQGMGGAGGGSGLTVGAGTGNMDAVGAFQGGISEVGYPPGIAPGADFSYDRGGWVGAYDPRYNYPTY